MKNCIRRRRSYTKSTVKSFRYLIPPLKEFLFILSNGRNGNVVVQRFIYCLLYCLVYLNEFAL